MANNINTVIPIRPTNAVSSHTITAMSSNTNNTIASTSNGQSSVNFTSLPVELLENIAEHADPADLLNLRETNSKVSKAIDKVFLRVHFTERAFILASEDSMTTLRQISQSTMHAKSMRKIIFCTDTARGDVRSIITICDYDSTEFSSEVLNRQSHLFRESDAQRHFWERGGLLKLLSEILSQLKRLGIEIEISITPQFLTARKAKGYKVLLGDFPGLSASHWPDRSASPLRIVLQAVSQSEIGISKFSAHATSQTSNSEWGVDLTDFLVFTPHHNLSGGAPLVFKTLRKLYIGFTMDFYTRIVDYASTLVNMSVFARISTLEELSINFGNRKGDFVAAFFDTKFPHLKHLIVKCMMHLQYPPNLLRFIQSQISLQTLVVEGTPFTEYGSSDREFTPSEMDAQLERIRTELLTKSHLQELSFVDCYLDGL